MLRAVYLKRFGKDVKRFIRRGKDTEKLKEVIRMLIREEKLDKRYKNHALKGDYKDCCDCHIEPDISGRKRIRPVCADRLTFGFIRIAMNVRLSHELKNILADLYPYKVGSYADVLILDSIRKGIDINETSA